MKPGLGLYMKWTVSAVEKDEEEDWKWAIVLKSKDREIRVVNKNRQETFAPEEIVGGVLATVSQSLYDTTLHIIMPNGHRISIGMNPTQYAILDPKFGGESYPQWPEELEEAGIPSHPDEDVSAKPSEEWPGERMKLVHDLDKRTQEEARQWLAEDNDEN